MRRRLLPQERGLSSPSSALHPRDLPHHRPRARRQGLLVEGTVLVQWAPQLRPRRPTPDASDFAACASGFRFNGKACVPGLSACKASRCFEDIPRNSRHVCRAGQCGFSESKLLAGNWRSPQTDWGGGFYRLQHGISCRWRVLQEGCDTVYLVVSVPPLAPEALARRRHLWNLWIWSVFGRT